MHVQKCGIAFSPVFRDPGAFSTNLSTIELDVHVNGSNNFKYSWDWGYTAKPTTGDSTNYNFKYGVNSHVYSVFGRYKTCLTYTDLALGCTSRFCHSIFMDNAIPQCAAKLHLDTIDTTAKLFRLSNLSRGHVNYNAGALWEGTFYFIDATKSGLSSGISPWSYYSGLTEPTCGASLLPDTVMVAYWLPCFGLQIHSSDYIILYPKGKQLSYDIVCKAVPYAFKASTYSTPDPIGQMGGLQVYPNPGLAFFRVNIPQIFQNTAAIQVVDITGHNV